MKYWKSADFEIPCGNTN